MPSVSSTISVHDILDDTSFAVAATSDGNRHVIFQDISGAIRDSFYSHTTSSWTSTSSWVVPGNARNHTPFSAIVQSFANSSQEVRASISNQAFFTYRRLQGIHLFYINNDNQLALSLFASGTWLSNRTTDYDVGNLGAFTAISSSRALTATPISHAPNMTSNAIDAFRVCLLYESHDGGNEVLLGTQVDRGYSYVTEEAQLSWSWQDITSGLTSEGFGADLTSPFGVSHELFGDASGALEVYGPFAPFQLYAFDQSQNNFSMLQFFPNNNTFSEGESHAMDNRFTTKYPNLANDRNGLDMLLGFQPLDPAPSPNETAIIRASDFFVPENGPSFGLWVKEGKLIMLPYGGSLMVPSGGPQEAPVSPFPFTRFAAVNITSFFLYHQINASCFAEEIWDSEALNWVSSTNISVSVWDQGE